MRRFQFQCVLLAAVAVTGFASMASAADMPTKAPVYTKAPTPAPVYNWSGFYVGGFIGGATNSSATTSDPCLVSAAAACAASNSGTYNGVLPLDYGLQSSFIGGGTIGYNWQMPGSRFVLGLENEIGYLHLRGSVVMNAPPIGNGDTTASTTVGNWYDAYTVRAGYAWNQFLLYAKAGGVSAAYSTGIVDTIGPTTINTTTNKVLNGWAAGGGLEYGMTKNWSLKAEYLHLGLGATVNHCAQVGGFPPGTIDCSSTKTNGVNTFKIGANYHFNWMSP
jgi:outer membrane immunogenic protein